MRPLILRGQVWRVVRVSPGDPFLIDRTGSLKIATTDPEARIIRISSLIMPPLFDKVYIHEAAHAAMKESGVTDILSGGGQVFIEELIAWFLEDHAIEIIDAVSNSLGRPACVNGLCMGGELDGNY